jgi:acyl transferase domain-containing protein
MRSSEPIAIVGAACRFPGSANSPSKLWELLKSPKDVLKTFPRERLNFSNFSGPDGEAHGRTDVQGQSYLLQEDCRVFDAAFFRISPKEARGMDPQQRVLLETVYEAFEAAGWPLEKVQGSQTSVHVGTMTTDYNDIQMRDPECLEDHAATGLARSILSNRISYVFDLKGASMTIDTACSSSLVGLHLAVQGLRNGDATQAIVAGSTLILDPGMYIAESSLHMLSRDSRSRMWDKAANGYARGEGCAAILLKPLSQAVKDGDQIECVIRETGVNSDGRTNGITMPSAEAQANLIRQTYEKAGLDPLKERCQYFECHGTGTLAGDPIEAEAIQKAFYPDNLDRPENDLLYCGSIKTVVGHLEGCAGLAGILKASLAIQNRSIPPNMHFDNLNPSIKPFYTHLRVPTSALPWPTTSDGIRRASVNSFGFGGTNAHALLESYSGESEIANGSSENGLGPFLFSGRSQTALIKSLESMLQYLEGNPSADLGAVSWVLQMRRSALPLRYSIPASTREGLLGTIRHIIQLSETSTDMGIGIRASSTDPSRPQTLLGVFTGQVYSLRT